MREEMNSKQKLIILVIILTLLIVGVNILKNFRNTDQIWNYDEITSATDVISSGSIVTDRKTYYELEDIIVRFLLANDGLTENSLETENIGYEASYKDYYDILTDEYKKHLSKTEFNDKATNFLSRFVKVEDLGYKLMNTTGIIKRIYVYDENKYLCELESNKNISYIGIELMQYNHSYNIFYIE